MNQEEMEAEQARLTFCVHMISTPERCGYCDDDAEAEYYKRNGNRGESRAFREAWKAGWIAAIIIPDRVPTQAVPPLAPLGKAREPLTITLSREDAYALTYACTAYLGGTDGVKHRMPLAKLRDKLDEAQGGESL